MVEALDDAFGDLRQIDIDIGLHGDIDLGASWLQMPRQSGKTI